MKIKSLFVILFVNITALNAHCVVFSCNNTISYAIQRYANKVTLRMNNLKKTIDISTQMEQTLHRVEDEKLLELLKERERIKITLLVTMQKSSPDEKK